MPKGLEEVIELLSDGGVIEKPSRSLTEQTHILDSSETDVSFFNPSPFIKSFEKTLQNLDALSERIDNSILKVSKEKEQAKMNYQEKLDSLQDNFQQVASKFTLIDKKISERSSTAVRIGERMDSIDKQREKISEAKLLIEQFSQLNRQQQLPAIMTDESKIYDRASLVKKLITVTEDLQSIPNKTQLGKQRVEECGSMVENSLIQLFDKAQSQDDYTTMKKCADALNTFNGGTSLIRKYISQQPIFLNAALWGGDTTLTEKKIKELFSEMKKTCKREQTIIQKVFPSSSCVMKQLLEKLFLQYIQRLLDRVLLEQEQQNEIEGLHKWLYLVNLLYDLTNELISEVSTYNVPDMDYSVIIETLFSDYLSEYADNEIRWLKGFYMNYLDRIKVETNSAQKPVDTPKNTRRQLFTNSKAILVQRTNISSEVAIEFIRANKEAVERSVKILNKENLCDSLHSILSILIQYLGYDYLECELDTVTLQCFPDLTTSAKIDKESIQHFLSTIQQVTTSIVLFIEYFQRSIFPHICKEESKKLQCLSEKNTLINRLENKIHPNLERIINAVIDDVNNILIKKQKKSDFTVADDKYSQRKEFSSACSKAIIRLKIHCGVVDRTLDGGNLHGYLTKLGVILYQTLLDHIKRQQISLGLGGMVLMKDITKFSELAASFKSNTVTEKFKILHDVVNLFLIPKENLQTLIEDSYLSKLDKDELGELICLRGDV